nr:MAG TPA: hypothetical protein [Caudoviricetes sp.]
MSIYSGRFQRNLHHSYASFPLVCFYFNPVKMDCQ